MVCEKDFLDKGFKFDDRNNIWKKYYLLSGKGLSSATVEIHENRIHIILRTTCGKKRIRYVETGILTKDNYFEDITHLLNKRLVAYKCQDLTLDKIKDVVKIIENSNKK